MSIRIKNNLWQVGGRGLTDPSDAASTYYGSATKQPSLMPEVGEITPQLRKNIAECLEPDVQLEYLLLTHCHFDHTGGAQAVRDEYGCRIVAHELDAIYLESGDNRVTGSSAGMEHASNRSPLISNCRAKNRPLLSVAVL